jgi:hypothetical protein
MSLSPGDRVEIVGGDFKAYSGVVVSEEQAVKANGHPLPGVPDGVGIWASIIIFGRDVTLKFPLSDVEPING